MAYHRFKIAQTVASLVPDIPTGPFVIIRLLPHIDREPQYCVISTTDGHERIMPESQIRLLPMAEGWGTASVRLVLAMNSDDDAAVGA